MSKDRNNIFSDNKSLEDKAFVSTEMDNHTREIVKNLRKSIIHGIKNDLKILERSSVLLSEYKKT